MVLYERHRRNLANLVIAILIATLIGIAYSLMFLGISLKSIGQGSFNGLFISFFLLSLEYFVFASVDRYLPFSLVLFIKTLIYTSIICVSLFLSNLLFGPEFPKIIWSNVLWHSIPTFFFAGIVSLFFILIFSVNRLLGRGVLLKFVTGTYHRPVLEERIFMYLDLTGSTSMAERLGPILFHSILNDFFNDITDALMNNKGQIYKYVGDEVIVSWPLNQGLKDGRCVRAFFETQRVIKHRETWYMAHYGVVPTFKASLHCGVVVTGEMGKDKREIVYLGDPLNTGSRILAECDTDNKTLLVSADLINRLLLPKGFSSTSQGMFRLRGKETEMELFSLARVPHQK